MNACGASYFRCRKVEFDLITLPLTPSRLIIGILPRNQERSRRQDRCASLEHYEWGAFSVQGAAGVELRLGTFAE
jgi:hypothetical protein